MPATTEGRAESRIGRLEIGFCAAFVIIVAGGFTLYDKLAERIDVGTSAQADMRGDIKVISSRLDGMGIRLDGMDRKLDVIVTKLDAKP